MLQGNSLLNTYRLLSNNTHTITKEFIKQVALYDRYKFTYPMPSQRKNGDLNDSYHSSCGNL
jgi:hypothetical protein